MSTPLNPKKPLPFATLLAQYNELSRQLDALRGKVSRESEEWRALFAKVALASAPLTNYELYCAGCEVG
ncbi:MAG: hypothetical protein AAB511_03090 [Patescibacteria group bacterium]